MNVAVDRYDRAAERSISKQLADSPLDGEDVPPGGSSAGDAFRSLVVAHERSSVLRNAIYKTGRHNYLVRFGTTNQWKAVIEGNIYSGTFNQVVDQIAHMIIHHVKP